VRFKRWGTAFAVIASLSLGLSACSGPANEDDTGSTGKDAKTSINVGWNQPFYSYNSNSTDGGNVTNANSQYLMNGNFWYYDAQSVLQKDTSFGTYEKISDDPLTVKYTVGPDTNWSDGTPVDAADLMLDWASRSGKYTTAKDDQLKTDDETGATSAPEGEVYFDGSSAGLALVTEVPEIGDDGKSLTLVYDKPFADWELDISPVIPAHAVGMLALGLDDPQAAKDALIKAMQDNDKAALAKVSKSWNDDFDYTSFPDDELQRLSNGPYVMTDLKENEFQTFEKNPDYKGQFPASIDTVTIRYNEDPMAQVQALQNGEIDMFYPQVTTDVVDAGKAIDGVEVISGLDGTYEHVDLQFANGGPFDPKTYGGDAEKAKLVREAFLKAVPRQEIIDKLIKPITPDAEIRNSFVRVAGTPGYDETVASNGSAEFGGGDPAAAKKILADAGVKTPVTVRLMFAKGNVRRESEFALYQAAMEKAGFQLVDKRDENWSAKLGSKGYDAVYFGWQSTTTGVTADCEIFRKGGANNLNGYDSKVVNDLCAELASTLDPDKQAELNAKVDAELFKDRVGLPIFQFPAATFVNTKRVSGVEPSVLSPTMFYGFWNWKAVF
jgi:peptide/nickel transport system substrate-binding protein